MKKQKQIPVTDSDGNLIGTALLDEERAEITLTRVDGATVAGLLGSSRAAISVGYRLAGDDRLCGGDVGPEAIVASLLGRPAETRERFLARLNLAPEQDAAWRKLLELPCP
jgi:hypothetical protein